MGITTLTGREFNQDIARAKRAAERGPVIITDRGVPAFVLQRYDAWRHQAGAQPGVSLLEALADPASGDIEFEPPKVSGVIGRTADLT
jgi:PHD/YefM family antitoxin component YafN of YafNO toxin-antitoxin module